MTTASDTGPASESAPWPIDRITLGVKRTGKRRTGNPFAPFEVAGLETGLRQTYTGTKLETADTAKGAYGAPRQCLRRPRKRLRFAGLILSFEPNPDVFQVMQSA